jgi:hypothetical protein
MPARAVAAIAVWISAGIHLKLWFDGTRHLDVVGPAFMLNAIAGVVIGVLLLTWRHWVPLFLSAGFGASTLGAFVISATVGLYGVNESFSGAYEWTSVIVEAVAVVAAVVAAVQEGWFGRWSGRQLQHPGAVRGAHLN